MGGHGPSKTGSSWRARGRGMGILPMSFLKIKHRNTGVGARHASPARGEKKAEPVAGPASSMEKEKLSCESAESLPPKPDQADQAGTQEHNRTGKRHGAGRRKGRKVGDAKRGGSFPTLPFGLMNELLIISS